MCTQTVLTTHLCKKCSSPMSNTTTTTTTTTTIPCEGGGGGSGGGTGTSSSSSNSSIKRCPGNCPGAGKTITKATKSGKICGACTLEDVRIYAGSF
ncbi:hypothetical protein B0T09DRAFT_394358 [Sordaria sp. MPI-SDFR-AT-0083]|nr:hypothetical protein B0T09DRAFT_394358 [Sordaria sp. MPI-SDFR-AT-0083]